MAFSFLDKISRKFETQFGSQSCTAIPFAMNTEFAPVLASEMKRANVMAGKEEVNLDTKHSSLFKMLSSDIIYILSVFIWHSLKKFDILTMLKKGFFFLSQEIETYPDEGPSTSSGRGRRQMPDNVDKVSF